ncbi:hypothetical protein [Bradyrhizobium niftali]|uniref:DUF1837 domain-containing protein n=1 Tax=Bradyrhizobium niftali TaxID=2560055 RepID=A0A4Y9L4T5_9BRAD|nr:hypothetical protein [Bradyrhizobium niftali]TFV37859.1 hypothetical protein E4K65_43160 [Bradyrhizobium niftali]
MIRFRRLTLATLNAWLTTVVVGPSSVGSYRLRLWRENRGALAAFKVELDAYLAEAFDDAKMRLRRGFEDPLSPFSDPQLDPAANYPRALHRVTLQGYFGETLAVIAVEHFGAHGYNDWRVPALLFRFHDQEFQHLELINERIRAGQVHAPDETREQRPGRTGDDGLAFRMSTDGRIIDVLTLEAKCLSANRPATIAEAHSKLAAASGLPSGVRELINILADYDTPQTRQWQEALIRYRKDRAGSGRADGVAYACGRVPSPPRLSWLSPDRPDGAYTIQRVLEGFEFQIADLGGLIDLLYRGA